MDPYQVQFTVLLWLAESPDLSSNEHVCDIQSASGLVMELRRLRHDVQVAWNLIAQENIDHLIPER